MRLLAAGILLAGHALAEDWAVSGAVYKNVKVISHDSKVVTISSSDGMATFSISNLDAGLQKRVLDDNATATDWTVNGTVYHHVVAGQVEPDRVHISCDGGAGTVQLSDLPPDLQKRFNYDPAQAKAAAQKREDDQRAADASEAAAAQQQQAQATRDAEIQKVQEAAVKGAIPVRGEVLSVIPVAKGDKAYLISLRTFANEYTGQTAVIAGGVSQTLVTGDTVSSGMNQIGHPVSNTDPTGSLLQINRWYYAGTFTYPSVAGATITCRVYSPSLEWAVKNLVTQAQQQ